MENSNRAGIFLLIMALIFLILLIVGIVEKLIRSIKLKYKETTGTVIKSINTSDPKYQRKRNEEYFAKHKSARKIYNFLIQLFPPEKQGESDDRGATYASVIQYTVDDKKYEIVSDFSSDRREKKNKKYKVKYNPENPTEAYVSNDRGKILMLIIIVATTILGLWLLFD